MGSRTLSKNERRVLAAMQHDSRITVAQIASKVRMRHHSVAYIVKELTERGVIRPYLLTNPHAVGLTDYCIFFNYLGEGKRARQRIIDFCVNSQQVAYFAELSGPYQFSVSLFCHTIFEVTEFFSELSGLLPRSSFESSFALRLEFTQFLGKWADPKATPKILERTRVDKEIVLDETDRRIVGFYSQHADLPLKKIAEFAGVSESTVRNRVTQLEKNKVIHSFPHFVNVNAIGVTTFRIILSAQGIEQSFRNKLYKYMVAHPRSSAFVHCAGAWDFELNFDVENNSQMGEIIEDITDNFGSHIRKMHTASEMATHRAHHFPLNAGLQIPRF